MILNKLIKAKRANNKNCQADAAWILMYDKRKERIMCVLIVRFLLALIMTKCVPHIFPFFFSESSSCQEDRKE